MPSRYSAGTRSASCLSWTRPVARPDCSTSPTCSASCRRRRWTGWPKWRDEGDKVRAPAAKSLAERCLPVELLVLDVDGVLTDGGIVYDDQGAELKRFHVRDGSALKLWRDAGKRAAILTGRSSPVVARRAAELGVGLVRQGCADKFAAYRELLAECGLRPEHVCAVGDDLPDVPMLRNSG